MFFKHREKEERFRRELKHTLDADMNAVKKEIGIGSTRLEEAGRQLQDGNRQLTEMKEEIGRLRASVQKHDMAIEDLLDEWSERSSDEADVRKRLQEGERSEACLLNLFEAYQEQFWGMRRFAEGKDSELAGQLTLMEQSLLNVRQMCGISIIQEVGVAVNYDLHEAIQIVDTTDPGLDGIVAMIYSCGYLYKGKVKKKAKVAVYRLAATNNTQNLEHFPDQK